jgi:hypothetical protein
MSSQFSFSGTRKDVKEISSLPIFRKSAGYQLDRFNAIVLTVIAGRLVGVLLSLGMKETRSFFEKALDCAILLGQARKLRNQHNCPEQLAPK